MHRYLYICVALAVVDPALIGQTRPQDQPSAPVSQQQQAPAQKSPPAQGSAYSQCLWGFGATG